MHSRETKVRPVSGSLKAVESDTKLALLVAEQMKKLYDLGFPKKYTTEMVMRFYLDPDTLASQKAFDEFLRSISDEEAADKDKISRRDMLSSLLPYAVAGGSVGILGGLAKAGNAPNNYQRKGSILAKPIEFGSVGVFAGSASGLLIRSAVKKFFEKKKLRMTEEEIESPIETDNVRYDSPIFLCILAESGIPADITGKIYNKITDLVQKYASEKHAKILREQPAKI